MQLENETHAGRLNGPAVKVSRTCWFTTLPYLPSMMGQEDAQPLPFRVQMTTLRWTEGDRQQHQSSPSIDIDSTAQHLLTVDNLKRTSNEVPHVSVTLLIVQYSWRDPSHSTAPLCGILLFSPTRHDIQAYTQTHTHTQMTYLPPARYTYSPSPPSPSPWPLVGKKEPCPPE